MDKHTPKTATDEHRSHVDKPSRQVNMGPVVIISIYINLMTADDTMKGKRHVAPSCLVQKEELANFFELGQVLLWHIVL